ncbi:MAG: hypothetical protein JO309_11985 [Pseudonocardiales bacterium]|nr:hypothetical protein [Pseudonocardiales bacterium]
MTFSRLPTLRKASGEWQPRASAVRLDVEHVEASAAFAHESLHEVEVE